MQTGLTNLAASAPPAIRAGTNAIEHSDEQLVAKAKSGSTACFEKLVERHQGKIYRLALTISHSREDAEEIAQNAFVQAFRNLAKFRGDSRFYTWLVRITVNEGLMKMRRRRSNVISIDDTLETQDGTPPYEIADDGLSPEQRYSRKEVQTILTRTIGQLSPGYRKVLQLRDVHGLSTEQTADALDLSLPAVKTRLRRARIQLRESLSKHFRPATGNRAASIGFVLVILLCLFTAMPAFAQQPAALSNNGSTDPDFFSRPYLFGDWGGERSKLAEHGVTFDFFYIADLLANPTGGEQQRATGWGRIRGTMDMDLGKLIGAKGLTFHVTGLWQFGTNLGANIGTLANPSGLVSAHTTRLDSFWLQQSLFHDHLFVKVGQFAGLDFYGNQLYGGSYVIEPLDYALGNLFPTTYESFNPAATPAAEIRVVPTANIYVKSAVLSGNRDPYQQDTTGFHFRIEDSPVFVEEAGYLVDPSASAGVKQYPGSYRVGAAYNGGKFFDVVTNRDTSQNYLVYVMANQAVYRAEPGSNRGLDLDFAFDWSPGDLNRLNSQTTAGFRYNGLIPHRTHDGLAFAFIYSKISDPYSIANTLLGLPPLGAEKAIEVNYAIQVTPWALIQPVFQYYANVGGDSQIPNAPVFGFRTKIEF